MNPRSLVLLLAVLLFGIGVISLISGLFAEAPPSRTLVPAVAAMQVKPYTVITQDMVRAGNPVPADEFVEKGMYPFDSVVGLMSTDQLLPGATLTGVNAKPVEEVRFVEDLGLEVISFTTGVDRAVGGQLRPGHIVNLYGFGRDRETNEPFTRIIEPRLWVVKVAAGSSAISNATPRPDPETGQYQVEGGDREGQATLITVAVQPQQAYNIVNTLGADGLQAWVTLAANQTADAALATPVATAAPPPTAGLSQELSLTATALWNLVNATRPASAPRTGYGGVR